MTAEQARFNDILDGNLQTLFEKSGAEGNYRRFKFELLKIIQKKKKTCRASTFSLEISASQEPSMRMMPKNPRPAQESEDRSATARTLFFPTLRAPR